MTMHKYCCPTCGHPVLPTDPLAFLFPTERAIFDVIYAAGSAGIRRQAVMDRVYRNGKNAASHSIVSVHVSRINKKLKWIGLTITSVRGGAGMFYDALNGWMSDWNNGVLPWWSSSDLFFGPSPATAQNTSLSNPYQAAGEPDPGGR